MSRLRLVFMGTPDIAVPSLRAVAAAGHQIVRVVTQPDRPAGRGRKLTRGPVARAARELGLPLIQPERIRIIGCDLRAVAAEAAVVLAYGQLLPASVLETFPKGCINVHFSLLPALRGAAPINWAIMRGHGQTGVSTMFMDQGLDTGDIIAQRATAIAPDETAGGLADRLAGMGAELLVETLELIAAGRAPRSPQDPAKASYAPRLKKDDGRLDPARPASELERLVRGCDPWPGAFLPGPAGPLRLFAPTGLAAADPGAAPGTILAPPAGADPALLWLACGKGALGVGRVQAPGKRRLPARDFLNGAHLRPGDSLAG